MDDRGLSEATFKQFEKRFEENAESKDKSLASLTGQMMDLEGKVIKMLTNDLPHIQGDVKANTTRLKWILLISIGLFLQNIDKVVEMMRLFWAKFCP